MNTATPPRPWFHLRVLAHRILSFYRSIRTRDIIIEP